jgi:hypothetical protein
VPPKVLHAPRRRYLKVGLAAAVTLVVAGGVSTWIDRPIDNRGKLTKAGRRTFRAVSATILEGSLLQPSADREQQLDALLERLDNVLTGLPQSTQREIAQLLALLGNPASRYALTGLRRSWDESPANVTSVALDNMRKSTNSLRQQAYHALRDLTNAAFYADPKAWPLMGYPGPTQI